MMILVIMVCLVSGGVAREVGAMNGLDMREYVQLTEGGFIQPLLKSDLDLPYID
jgi:hypothetical protein